MQHRRQLALHGGELALGDADFVGARRRRNDAVGIFRIGAERHHVAGDAAHRAHEHVMQRQIDQRRGDHGNHQRQQKNIHRIAQHGAAQRPLVHDQFDIFAAHRRRADHPHHIGAGIEHDLEGIDDGIDRGGAAHVVGVVDGGRHVVDGQHAAALAHLHGDGAGADRVEDLLGEAVGHHAVRRGFEHQRRGIAGCEAVLEPGDAEIGHRRHIDQHFRDHHEQDREDEELSRKPKAWHPDRPRPGGSIITHSRKPRGDLAFAKSLTETAQPPYDATHLITRQTPHEICHGGAFSTSP